MYLLNPKLPGYTKPETTRLTTIRQVKEYTRLEVILNIRHKANLFYFNKAEKSFMLISAENFSDNLKETLM